LNSIRRFTWTLAPTEPVSIPDIGIDSENATQTDFCETDIATAEQCSLRAGIQFVANRSCHWTYSVESTRFSPRFFAGMAGFCALDHNEVKAPWRRRIHRCELERGFGPVQNHAPGEARNPETVESTMGNDATQALALEFTGRAAFHLREEFLPRIGRAARRLGNDDLWWRPNPSCTSAGNLLLHLEGNVRQWILSGLGERPDERVRQSEFDAEGARDVDQLLAGLRSTVEEACTVIESLDADALLARHDIQVFEGVTALAAVTHVVEHFSWHTGQVAWIAKLRSGEDLAYYEQPLD